MPEITEKKVRIPVADKGSFQKDSFRTITLSAKDGIKAVIGRKKGETKTTVQSILFDKERWTMERAKAWVKKHGYSVSASIKIGGVSYNTSFEVDVLTASDGNKKVILRGKLLYEKINENGWHVKETDYATLASSFIGKDLKMFHSGNEWEIVGVCIDAYAVRPYIYYEVNVTDTRAKDKFLTGTWNAKNMGVSPSLDYSKVECSICGSDIRECGHKMNHEYGGKIAIVTPIDPTALEISLTSDPAYGPTGAGTIDEIDIGTLVASVNDIISEGGIKMAEDKGKTVPTEEVKKLTEEKTELEAKMAEKEKEVSELKASLKAAEEKEPEKKDKKKEEGEEEKKKKKEEEDKVEEVKAEKKKVEDMLLATTKKYDDLVAETRKSVLAEVISDEKLIAETLEKKFTDSEFTAEVGRLTKLKELFASQTGSASPDGKTGEKKTLCEASFDMTAEEMLTGVVGKKLGGKE